jgi:hypothetical protein
LVGALELASFASASLSGREKRW